MSDHAQQNAAILDQFGKQAEAYAALMLRNPDSVLPFLLEAVRPSPDDRMLDVGCGTGRISLALAPLVSHVTGVDLTPAMLDQARALQADAGISNIEWREADVTALPFLDGAFSLVTCRAMLHHTLSPAAVLAEMGRVCARHGRIAVTDLTPAAGKSAAFDAIEILRDPSHVHAMPADELRAIGASLGLHEIAVHIHKVRLSLEAVLVTSFPAEGMLDRVRELYRRDAESGADALGLAAQFEDGAITVAYPSTLVVWTRP
jgi:ubiquinone/menaquinone biosynthesis C-methylase UbiE